jgi:hypothetical protein
MVNEKRGGRDTIDVTRLAQQYLRPPVFIPCNPLLGYRDELFVYGYVHKNVQKSMHMFNAIVVSILLNAYAFKMLTY